MVRWRVVIGRRTGGPLGFTDQRGEREEVVVMVLSAEYQFLVLGRVKVQGGHTAECVPSHVVQPGQYYIILCFSLYHLIP